MSPTLSRPQGNDCHVVALDGDKLKPREDQRKGGNGFGINEEGAGYTLTGVDRHGVAYETQVYENHAHGVVSTNSNGEDVAATLTRDLAKQTGAQQQNGGGYCLTRREDSALTDSGSTETGR